jgi:kojibiose phosphorylase
VRTRTGWEIIFDEVDLGKMNHLETVMMVGNGYLCTRGSFPEYYHEANVATFVHGVFDDIPISFTELVNVPDWTALSIRVNGEEFSLRKGKVHSLTVRLDMKTGLLARDVVWESPSGNQVEFRFERFVSMANQHLMMQRVMMTALNFDGEVEILANINGFALNQSLLHWKFIAQQDHYGISQLVIQTEFTKINVAVSESIEIVGKTPQKEFWDVRMQPTRRLRDQLVRGETVVVEKRASIITSRDTVNVSETGFSILQRSALRSWAELYAENISAWEKLWASSDIEIISDDDAQLMTRFSIYQLLIAGPQNDEQVNIGAKTLSGYGYRGHVFWDTEIFMLPFFSYTQPHIAKNLISYRFHRLPGARQKAKANGFEGAQFPWESAATGEEVTPKWVPNWTPHQTVNESEMIRIWTGDIQIHISADIAYAIMQYWQVSGDDNFIKERGAQVIFETAQFWASRVEWNDQKKRYEITDVIGPDENHDHVDNNVFTNRMVIWHLHTAAQLYTWMKDNAPDQISIMERAINLTPNSQEEWLEKASKVYLPDPNEDGIIEQFEGFFDLEDVDFSNYADRTLSMQQIFGVEGCQKVMALKQADVVMLHFLLRNEYERSVIEKNYDYYSARTDHEYGSSLGPAMHALVANWINRPDEAYQHFLRAAKADLYDVRGNVSDGIHAASLGGVWQAVVFGFAGLTVTDDGWAITPRLPKGWRSIKFHFWYKGKLEEVVVTRES